MSKLLHAFMHPRIYLLKPPEKKIRTLSITNTTTRHRYYTRANKSRIMVDYESDNITVKETLAQVQGEMNLFRGNMETILEILQAQRASTSANPVAANITNVVRVTNATADVVAAVETPLDTMVPTAMNQHLFSSIANRLVAAYP